MPPPLNNMWRATESATIEERRRHNLCGLPDLLAIFSHAPQQSDSGHHTKHRQARLLTIAPCTVGIYFELFLLTGSCLIFYRFHIDQSTRLYDITSLMINTNCDYIIISSHNYT